METQRLLPRTYIPELQLQRNGRGGRLEQTGSCGLRVNTVTAVAVRAVDDLSVSVSV